MGDSTTCAQSARAALCDKDANFLNILESEKDSADLHLLYFGATPAGHVEGFGLTCALSNVANAGLDPASFHDAGYKVDNTGTRTPAIPGPTPRSAPVLSSSRRASQLERFRAGSGAPLRCRPQDAAPAAGRAGVASLLA